MFPPVFQTLKASTVVKNIVGTNPPRIYKHGDAPQRADNLPLAEPYITWFVVSDAPEIQLSGTPGSDRVSVQVDCWHQTSTGIETLAEAVRDALEAASVVTVADQDGREPETRLYRMRFSADFFVHRTS